MKSLSRVRLFATPWTVAHQAPPSMGFSKQEYWSGLPISFSRGSSQPRNQIHMFCISCTGRQLLYHCAHLESSYYTFSSVQFSSVQSLSRVRLFATSWTVTYETPPSMEFFRQENWSGLPISFSRGSSRPRDRTHVSCITNRCFYHLSHQGS